MQESEAIYGAVTKDYSLGRLDFKLLIDLSKMIFYHNSATCSLCIVQCCLSRTMRLAIVKTLFYSYGVGTGCYVGLNGVFNKFKESIF